MKRSTKILIITAIIVLPIFCLVMGITGLVLGYEASYATSGNQGGLNSEQTEAEILRIAVDYAATNDFEAAMAQLEALNLPNSGQYISFMVDRYIQENGQSVETQNLYLLATAMGTGTTSMSIALSSPTPVPTDTPLPTETPTPEATSTEESVEDTPAEGETQVEVAAEATTESSASAVEEPTPTETPIPTDTPIPPTDTPIPPTPVPAPPTDTPEPTATPEPPKPAVDFSLVEAYLIPNPTYNTCPGTHQIFVTIIDVNGQPLDGVTVEDTFRAVPAHVSGEKGPGKLEYDLWNNGFALEITKKEDGAPAISDVTPKLSSWDEDIPNEWLVQANYCSDLADCAARKGGNQLCRGHYAYNVTFKKTY